MAGNVSPSGVRIKWRENLETSQSCNQCDEFDRSECQVGKILPTNDDSKLIRKRKAYLDKAL